MNKIKIVIIVIIIICIALAAGTYVVYSNRVIGNYYGSEYEFIRIGNDVYEFDANDPYTSSDKGMKLGRVVSENNSSSESMYIWSVKGTKDYIYRVWGLYDGGFYKKVE